MVFQHRKDPVRRGSRRQSSKEDGRCVRLAAFALVLLCLIGCTPVIPEEPLLPVQEAAVQTPSPTEIPSPTPEKTPAPVPTVSPSPTWGHAWPEIDVTQWQYRLVNPWNKLEEGFNPRVDTSSSGVYFDARAVAALDEMISTAVSEGVYMYASSGYRTIAAQQYLYDRKIKQKTDIGWSYEAAEEYARKIVAYPGTSEHNLGLAADIVDKKYDLLTDAYAETDAAKWLLANCARFGFILRYPKGKEEITGITYEPWHFRYVGVEAAEYIMANGICLEEFLQLYAE